MQRRDAHIHLGDIDKLWNLTGEARKAMSFKLGRRIHPIKPTTIEDVRAHIVSQHLAQACLYCDDADTLAEATLALSGIADISPIYWVRDWARPNIPPHATGVKIHPMCEMLDAKVGILRGVLDTAQEQRIPVLFHMEDENLTRSRGKLMSKLAKSYPDVTLIGCHAGAYGAPQFLGVSYLDRYRRTMIMLVSEMIEAAKAHENIYLETSCLAFFEKAQLLREATRENPELLDKILMGSDFPLPSDAPEYKIYSSFAPQEDALRKADFSDAEIQMFYDNVRKVIPTLSPEEPSLVPYRKQAFPANFG
jgi:hypothetical protein